MQFKIVKFPSLAVYINVCNMKLVLVIPKKNKNQN